MNYKNGYFQLITKPDGTYMKLYPPQKDGDMLEYNEISNYLARKKIADYDLVALHQALSTISEIVEIKLMETKIYPVNEEMLITISEDRMNVVATFYPPSNLGKKLTKADIIDELVYLGIKFGVLGKVIDDFLANPQYCTTFIIAKAQPPMHGTDAVITYEFNTNRSQKPKTNEDGSVDFHQLDIITHVNKGDILATLTPADLGKSGIDVCGNEIKPKKVVNKNLKHSKDIYLSPDKKTMYSEVSGHVSLIDGKVFVSNTFEILADVDASTGDIVYEGNVIIKGNVITGFSIKAKGDIEVNGAVEGAILCAGGQIILKRGIQGMNKGILEAGGNIITKFIENSVVRAGGHITTDSIMHSNVSAKGDITIGGRRGFVTGGEVRSASMITVKTAGSTMGTSTLLEVGIDPLIGEEFRKLEKELIHMNEEKIQITQIINVLRKMKDAKVELTPMKVEQLQKATRSLILSETKIKQACERYEKLKIEMNSNTNGRIKVQGIAYPGVKVIISNVNYFVRSEQKFCQFVRDKADIKVIGY